MPKAKVTATIAAGINPKLVVATVLEIAAPLRAVPAAPAPVVKAAVEPLAILAALPKLPKLKAV